MNRLTALLLGALVAQACMDTRPVRWRELGIYDGEPDHEHPGVVRIRRRNNTFDQTSCSGTLVAPRVVVTAKHCLGDMDPFDMAVEVGPEGELAAAAVAGIRTTEGETWRGQDFAVLLLEEPLEVPVFRYARSAALQVGDPITLVGYGRRDAFMAGMRRNGDAAITSVQTTTFTTEGAAVCFGDSGGAAFDEDEVLVGVITHFVGPSPCEDGMSGLTRVDAYLPIVDQAIADHQTCVPAEVCGNSWDDDCNGSIDDACVEAGFTCTTGADCVSGDCRDLGDGSRCVAACASDEECPAGTRCEAASCTPEPPLEPEPTEPPADENGGLEEPDSDPVGSAGCGVSGVDPPGGARPLLLPLVAWFALARRRRPASS